MSQERAAELVCFEARLFDEGPELGGAAVDELGPELDDLVAIADGEDAAAGAGRGLEEGDRATLFCEAAGGGKPCHTGPDDDCRFGVHKASVPPTRDGRSGLGSLAAGLGGGA